MKKHVTTLLFSLATILLSAQCYLLGSVRAVVRIDKVQEESEAYILTTVKNTSGKYCFSSLVDSNEVFVDYLLTNFTARELKSDLLSMEGKALEEAYYGRLQADSLFGSVIKEWTAKCIDRSEAKDSLSVDAVLNIAVKYFSILRINKDGFYVGKVCVGLNDIKKTEANRNAFLEAFCFSTILTHYQDTENNLYNEFGKSIQELYKLNLGIDNNEKLLRAQGALYMLMRLSPALHKTLEEEYKQNHSRLPFVVMEWE
jgi:hypothetical protein